MWDLSYPSRDWTHTPCIRSQNTNYWTVRKVPTIYVYLLFSQSVVSDPIYCSTPGFSVLHHLLELAQTYVHWVGDAIQPSHLLSSPSSPAFNLSQHQGLFQWVSSFPQVAKVLELQLQHQSFQWIFRLISLRLTGLISFLSKGLSRVFSSTTFWRPSVLQCSAFSVVQLSLLWASLVAQLIKNLPAVKETWVLSLGGKDPLEKGKAAYSSFLAWRIPWTVDSPWARKESDMTEWLSLSLFTFSHLYLTTGKTIALTIQTFVGKVMSLLFNMLSRFVIAFIPRSKHLLKIFKRY